MLLYLITNGIKTGNYSITTTTNRVSAVNDDSGGAVSTGATCSTAGVNTATFLGASSNDFEKAEGYSMGYGLAIVNSVADLDKNKICNSGLKVIVRPCTGTTGEDGYCSLYDTDRGAFINALNNIGCTVYVTGPNEAPRELYKKYGSIDGVAKLATEYANDFIAKKASNVKLLTTIYDPIFGGHTGAERASNFDAFINALNSNGYPVSRHDGVAVNVYNINDKLASGHLEDFLGKVNTFNLPIFVTETGKIEQRADVGNVSPSTAVDNLKTAFKNMVNRGVTTVMFFNAFGSNTDPNFKYGNISEDQDGDGRADIEEILEEGCKTEAVDPEDPDENGSGGNTNSVEYLRSQGCCQYTDYNAIKSCEILQGPVNGTQETKDTVRAGLRMVPADPANPEGSGWKYRYVVTEQIHNLPLMNFFSNFEVNGTDDHPYLSDAAADTVMNYFPGIDFTNQFEGILQMDIEGTNPDMIQIGAPGLGNAAAAGQISWVDIKDPMRVHCGLKEDPASDDKQNEQATAKFTDYFQNEFDKASKSILEIILGPIIDILKSIFNGANQDVCVNTCGATANKAIVKCDYSDQYVLPRTQFERIIGGDSENDTVMTPAEMCDSMFGDDMVVGGTCVMKGSKTYNLNYNGKTKMDLTLCNIKYGAGSASCKDPDILASTLENKEVHSILKSGGYSAAQVKCGGGGCPYFRQAFGQSESMKLEGMLKVLENTYELERYYTPKSFAGKKICHRENIGINITATRRLYDKYVSATNVGPNAGGINIPGRENAPIFDPSVGKSIPEQLFKIGDPKGQYGSCSAVKNGYFTQPNPADGWGLGTTQDSANDSDQPNTQATVFFIYPWLGQIPKMWERVSVWTNNLKDVNATSVTNPVSVFQFLAGSEFGKVYLRDCKDAGPDEDCLCGQEETDPLEEYLKDNGMLLNSPFNLDPAIDTEDRTPIPGQYNDVNNDGIPDICQFPGDVDNGNGSGGDSGSGGTGNNGGVDVGGGTDNIPVVDTGELQSPVKGSFSITQCFGPTTPNQTIEEDLSACNSTPAMKAWCDAIRDRCTAYGNGFNRSGIGYNSTYFHHGLDIGTPPGTPIYASAPGTVLKYGQELDANSGYGISILIRHANGIETRYSHLSSTNAAVLGDNKVTAEEMNTPIGYSGQSGNVSGPHLDFEIRKGNAAGRFADIYVWEDPMDVYRKGRTAETNSKPTVAGANNTITATASNSGGTDVIYTEGKPKYCQDYKNSSDNYPKEYDVGSYKDETEEGFGFECLMKDVADFANKEYKDTTNKTAERIPWEIIWAITYQETKGRCTQVHDDWYKGGPSVEIGRSPLKNKPVYFFDDRCAGQPDQPGMYIGGNRVAPQVRGVTQFSAGTFDAITKNVYWEKALYNYNGPVNTTDFMEKCTEKLGVKYNKPNYWTNTQYQENPSIYSGILISNRIDRFSRLRVGDSLCATAAMLMELAASYKGGVAAGSDWDKGTVFAASSPYHGNCSLGYCDSAWDWYNFAKNYFKGIENKCSTPSGGGGGGDSTQNSFN